jgi:hypothetical protein
MQGQKEFWQAQLLGLKRLPEESGAWGLLLPASTIKNKTHQADAADSIDEINLSWLKFDTRDVLDMNRGYLLVIGMFVFGFMGFSLLVFAAQELLDRVVNPGWNLFLADGLLLAIAVSGAVVAYRAVRAPLVEPFVLLRPARRFHVWTGPKQGWKSWAYDELVPFTLVSKLVTSAGASTVYTLRLALIDPKTREIKECIAPAPMQRTPEACGQVWQFIREYMDGKPEDLPAVRSRPSIHDKAADLVRFDRRFGSAVITPDHRIARGVLPKCFYWFWAVVDYWQMRAMAWIQRTAPRPLPPQELAQVLAWQGSNPYRFIELTSDERLANQGKLPRLRIRWMVAGVLATLLWGGTFVMMCYGILSTLWEK